MLVCTDAVETLESRDASLGVGFWVYIFVDCIAVELGRGVKPFQRMDLTGLQWFGYAAWLIGTPSPFFLL